MVTSEAKGLRLDSGACDDSYPEPRDLCDLMLVANTLWASFLISSNWDGNNTIFKRRCEQCLIQQIALSRCSWNRKGSLALATWGGFWVESPAPKPSQRRQQSQGRPGAVHCECSSRAKGLLTSLWIRLLWIFLNLEQNAHFEGLMTHFFRRRHMSGDIWAQLRTSAKCCVFGWISNSWITVRHTVPWVTGSHMHNGTHMTFRGQEKVCHPVNWVHMSLGIVSKSLKPTATTENRKKTEGPQVWSLLCALVTDLRALIPQSCCIHSRASQDKPHRLGCFL